MQIRLALLLTITASGCGGEDRPPEAPQRGGTATVGPVGAPVVTQPPVAVPPELPPLVRGPLVVDPGGFQLGWIAPNTTHEAQVTLHNAGGKPIRMLKTSSSCACTAPAELEGTVIAPGGTVPFSTTFTARASPGEKTAKIMLSFQAGDGPVQHALIELKGEVTMAVRADPSYVEALKGVRWGDIRIDALDGRPFRVISTFGQAPAFADGFDPAAQAPRAGYTLRWEVDYPRNVEDCGRQRLWWVIETDHPDCPILPVEIRHECTGALRAGDFRARGWLFHEYVVNLGWLRAGEPVEVDVELWRIADQETVPVHAVESLTPEATATLVSTRDLANDTTTCRVRFTARRGYEGLLYAMVMVRTSTGDQDVAFIAKVRP